MNPFKIIGWVALAIAVIGAFVEIPYAGLLLVLLGLAGGFAIAAEDHVRVLVSALVLTSLSRVLMNIPEIGQYLTSIFRRGRHIRSRRGAHDHHAQHLEALQALTRSAGRGRRPAERRAFFFMRARRIQRGWMLKCSRVSWYRSSRFAAPVATST